MEYKTREDFVAPPGPRVKEPDEYTIEEIRALIDRRGGYEAETKPPPKGKTSPSWGRETDWEICQSVGLRVWEFNEMIARYVRHKRFGT